MAPRRPCVSRSPGAPHMVPTRASLGSAPSAERRRAMVRRHDWRTKIRASVAIVAGHSQFVRVIVNSARTQQCQDVGHPRKIHLQL